MTVEMNRDWTEDYMDEDDKPLTLQKFMDIIRQAAEEEIDYNSIQEATITDEKGNVVCSSDKDVEWNAEVWKQ